MQLDLDGQLLRVIIYDRLNIKSIESLLIRGANPNTFNVSKTTPLSYAILQKNIELVQLLLKYGADPNFTASGEVTPPPLIGSIYYGNIEITLLLIANGSDINIRDRFGRTALIYSTKNKNIRTTELLFKHGADIHISDNDGRTALMYAQDNLYNRYIDIFCTLINKHSRIEFLIYLEGSIQQSEQRQQSEQSEQRQQAITNNIGLFAKIASRSRQYWKIHILSFLSEDSKGKYT